MQNWPQITVSAWIKHDTGAGAGTNDIISWWNYSGGSTSWVLTHHSNDQYFWELGGKSNITGGTVSTNWTQVVGTYNSSSGIMRLYENGIEVASTTGQTGNLNDSNAKVRIATQDEGTNYFDGMMDEIRISNIERSAAWIKTEYNNQNDPSAFLSVQAEETGPGPVGYWTFNEGYGTTANDESGQGNNGTITGATWQDESMCVSGRCLYFDGDDYVEDNNSLGITDYPFTFAGWVKYIDGNSGTIFSLADKDEAIPVYRINVLTGGYAQVGARHNAGVFSIATDNRNITNGWHYVVGVYNSNLDRQLYVDGVYRAINTEDRIYNTAIDRFSIGRTGDSSDSDYLTGFIDEVKIYPYARTADEIKQDYAAGLAGIKSNSGVAASFGSASDNWMSDGLVGYWQMDESATTSGAVDASGNGNTMTYYGDASTTAGKYGTAAEFDGTGDVVSILDTNLSSTFPGKNGYNAPAMTLGMWIKYDSFTGRPIRKPSIWQLASNVFGLVTSAGSEYFTFTGITTGSWYHMVVVYDGAYIYGYVDGESNSQPVPQTGAIQGNTQEFNIGAGGYPVLYPSDCQFDEVRIYNRALSPREVKKLYEWAPGPVAWWKFDEMAGDTAYDSAASTTYSGGNHGTLGAGTASYEPRWTQGKYGSALDFDGSNDYVYYGNPTSLQITNELTISAWVKGSAQTHATWEAGIAGKYISATNQRGYSLNSYNDGSKNKLQFHYQEDPAAYDADDMVISNSVVFDNTWKHIVGVFKPSSYGRIYINGVLDAEDTTVPATIVNNIANFEIGRVISSDTEFKGLIDDVRIYNYARTQKQILEDMSAGSASGGNGALKYPVLDLKFDEGYGGTAHDSSIHKNNGTLFPGTGGSNTATSAMWSLDGREGKAMEFDGIDDIVIVADNVSLKNFTSFTLAAWINPRSSISSNGDRIISKAQSGTHDDYAMYFTNDDKLGARIDTTAGASYYEGTTVMSYGEWYHVIAIWSGSVLTGYINGVEEGTPQNNSGILDNSNYDLAIGKHLISTLTREFDGLIDEVKIYNYALSEDEIKTLYNSGVSAVMGAGSTATTGAGVHVPSNAAARAYCVPGGNDYCAAPVLDLDFNEKTGTTTYDKSGNGNDGVFVNAASSPVWDRGKIGSALRFDGSDDYIEISGNIMGISEMTLSTWVKPDSIVTKRIYSRSAFPYTELDIENTNDNYSFTNDAGSTWAFSANNSATANIWQHVTVARNSSNQVTFYINGIQSGSANQDVGTPTAGGAYNYIGTRFDHSVGFFDGLIDHVKIYNYARTPAQIAWDYNRGKPIAHWKFDECSGGTIYDQSQRCIDTRDCNNGTLYLGDSGVTATGTCASSSDSFWYNGRDGKRNSGGSFDGGDDYVDLGAFPEFEGLAQFTASAWVRPSQLRNNDTPLGKFQNNGWSMQVYSTDGILSGVTNDGSDYCRHNGPLIAENTWAHWVIVYDGSAVGETNKNKLFFNGTYTAWSSCSGTQLATTQVDAWNMKIGDVNDGSRPFTGLIDEVKIWNYALTAEQIKTEYAGGAVRFGD